MPPVPVSLALGRLRALRLGRPVPTVSVSQIVAAACVLLAIACLVYVGKYGVARPFADEWDMAYGLTGDTALSVILFGHHNEHRYPIGQVAWYAVSAAAGADFRAGMVANVLFMASAAGVLVRAAAAATGRASLVDLLFPALLLNLGHSENWLMGYQMVLMLPLLGAAGVLAAAALSRPETEAKWGLIGGAGLVVAATGGGYGMVFAPPVLMWLGLVAWRVWRRDRRPGAALGLVALAGVVVAYLAVSVATLPAEAQRASAVSLDWFAWALLAGVAHTAGSGAGVAGGFALGWVVLALDAVALARLAGVAVTNPAERGRAVGIAAVILGLFGSAVAVAYGRGTFAERHALPVALHGCAVVMALRVYPIRVGPAFLPGGLGAFAAVAVVAVNWAPGTAYGKVHQFYYRLFAADVAAGMPARFLGAKHAANVYGGGNKLRGWLPARITTMQRAGVGQLDAIRPDPPVRTVPGPSQVPVTVRGTPFPDADAIPGPADRAVGAAVTVRASHHGHWSEVVLEWEPADGGPVRSASVFLRPEPADQTVEFWVDDRPKRAWVRAAGAFPEWTATNFRWLVAAE